MGEVLHIQDSLEPHILEPLSELNKDLLTLLFSFNT